MPTQAPDVPAPEAGGSLEVQVTRDLHGGWQVDALSDGHVVASRHCDDWHRVERTRHALAAELQRIAVRPAGAPAR